jgi:hypothetical protein
MNKNLFIYSFKYLAVLLALVTFSSCERDEFTEQDAFDLQQAQLDAQSAREEAALAAQDKRIMDMAMFRRSMDSLTRLNSGGKVFYTVNVVPGGSSAFSSGRFEEIEGLDGATVTVSQLGGAVVEQKVTVAGLASFEMYSGEVTVNVEAPNHTDLNYTANLTPDGGVPNGALMYVGNVVPVFDDPNNPAPGFEENLATVKGYAFSETDITFGNNTEETVPDGTKIRAFINVGDGVFRSRYLNQANDEGVNNGGQPTASGAIQRFAYEEAASTVGSTVTSPLAGDNPNDGTPEGGEYSISIGATASGLPITMKFDDFAENRIYVFSDSDGDDQIIFGGNFIGAASKRYIYTQNTSLETAAAFRQSPTPIPFQGGFDLANFFSNFVFDFATTEATAVPTLTGGDAVASVTVTDGGYYYVPPVVTFSAAPTGGTTATGTAVLGDLPAPAVLPAVDSPELIEARANNLKRVVGVTLTGAGSGYLAAPSVTFTRVSYTGRDAGGLPVANGTGNILAPTTGLSYVQIIDGGFGMTTPVAPFNTQFEYTGFAPTVVFSPDVTIAGNTAATAIVAVDENIGVASEVQIVTNGTGYDQATVTVGFTYGLGGDISTAGQTDEEADGVAIFESNGNGGIRFNDAVPNAGNNIVNAATPATAEYALEEGRGYSFVPRVTVTGLPPTATSPTFVVTVDGDPLSATFGEIVSIGLNGEGANITAALEDVELGGLGIDVTPFSAEIEASAFTSSGGIDNYVLTNYGQPTEPVYRSAVNNAEPNVGGGSAFNYISVNTLGEYQLYVDGAATGPVLATRPAVPTEDEFNDNSNFQIGFLAPDGGAAASGYPIFDNEGISLVGIVIKSAGVNYNPNVAHPFWVIPNGVTLAEYAQLGTNAIPNANANATAVNTTTRLTLTFTNGGLGYAVRPEFLLSGGNKSAEDMAGINTALSNAVRDLLTFNSQGEITNTSVNYTGALPFTAADLAAEPLSLSISSARLAAVMSTEASDGNGLAPFNGFIEVSAANDTQYDTDFAYFTAGGATAQTALNFFNLLEGSAAYTAEDRQGFGGANRANFQYITAPTVEVEFLGLATGFTAIAVLNPAADISALETLTAGTLPGGLVLNSFFYFGNDPSYPAAGERFRTLGGPESFEVFSGVTYIRDANYGTGIELE